MTIFLLLMAVALELPVLITVLGLRVYYIAKHELTASEPHCTRCDYILTGTESDVCPECGNPKKPDGVSYINRRSQKRLQRTGGCLAALGVFLFLLGALALLPVLS